MASEAFGKNTPRCVQLVIEAAERLDHLMRPRRNNDDPEPLHPIIEIEPKDRQHLELIARQALAWQIAVFRTYGLIQQGESNPTPQQEEAAGILWHFWPPDGPFTSDHPSMFLGVMPADLRRNPAQFRSVRPSLCDIDGYKPLKIALDNWSFIASQLTVRRQIIQQHCKALVDWVRAAVAPHLEGQLPRITEEQHLSLQRGTRIVQIACNGTSRPVTLTGTSYSFLARLASVQDVREVRKTKSQLCQAIPELDSFIRTVRKRRATPSSTESIYQLAIELRPRINLLST